MVLVCRGLFSTWLCLQSPSLLPLLLYFTHPIYKCKVNCHCYEDSLQMCFSTPDMSLLAKLKISPRLSYVTLWMPTHQLHLHMDKREFLVFLLIPSPLPPFTENSSSTLPGTHTWNLDSISKPRFSYLGVEVLQILFLDNIQRFSPTYSSIHLNLFFPRLSPSHISIIVTKMKWNMKINGKYEIPKYGNKWKIMWRQTKKKSVP